jgi:RHS repeat-associated protein
MAGDKFNLNVNSWWKSTSSPGTPVSPLSELITALSNGIAPISGGHATSSELTSSGLSSAAATGFLNSQSYNSSRPKAFVNWIFLDEQFKYYSGGFAQVGASNVYTTHTYTNTPVNKSGYLYVYVSNETPNIDVFFDNLQVTHIRGPLVEETHYYPFGLTMNGISSKALNFGNPENKEKFVEQILDDDLGLNWYQFKWRNHDPQIGRFLQVDPLSDKYVYNTTYAYAENRVIDGIDLEGLEYLKSIDKFKTDNGNWEDYTGAICNGVINILNIFPSIWNSAVSTTQSINRGTYLQDLGNELNGTFSNIKSSVINEYNYTISTPILQQVKDAASTISSPKSVEFVSTLFMGAGAVKGFNEIKNVFTPTVSASEVTSWYHTTTAVGHAENILEKGIDITFSKPTSRFGQGFYMSDNFGTNLSELAHAGKTAASTIKFSLSGGSFINVTSRAGGILTRYTPKLLSGFAKALNKDGIIFNSVRDSGTNLVMFKNFNLLKNGTKL